MIPIAFARPARSVLISAWCPSNRPQNLLLTQPGFIEVDRATALPSSLAEPRLMRKSLPVAPVQRFVGRRLSQHRKPTQRQEPKLARQQTDELEIVPPSRKSGHLV